VAVFNPVLENQDCTRDQRSNKGHRLKIQRDESGAIEQ